MNWWLGNSIRMRLQICFQLWRTYDEDVNKAWEHNKGSMKTSAKVSLGLHELKQHKSWFDEKCLVFLHQGKRAKCTEYKIQIKAIQIILTM